MENLVICKACGYVMKEHKVGEKCPACGLPKTVFKPHKEKMSAKRKFILELALHPITVHFPQAFAISLPILIILDIIFHSSFGPELISVSKIMCYVLPFTVMGAFISGLIDGKTRFKTISTPALIQKIIIASVLLLFSIAIFVLAVISDFESGSRIIILVLSVCCVICEIILGKIGSKLMYAKMAG